MARTNTTTPQVPQAEKVHYRNIVCSSHANEVWRKQHSKDRSDSYQSRRTEHEWKIGETEARERVADHDMAEQISELFEEYFVYPHDDFDYISPEEEERLRQEARDYWDNDPIHNFGCTVRHSDLSSIYGEYEFWDNQGYSIRHMRPSM